VKKRAARSSALLKVDYQPATTPSPCGGDAWWLNPGEEAQTVEEALALVDDAACAYSQPGGGAGSRSAGWENDDDESGAPREAEGGPPTPAACRRRGPRQLAIAVLNAFGTGGALEAATDALLGIGPTPQTVAAIAELPTESSLHCREPGVSIVGAVHFD
jgi:hypothetical protein